LAPASLAASLAAAAPCPAADAFVFFGTHRAGPSLGFSVAHFDTETGALTRPRFDAEAVAPAYFVIGPDGRRLYTCNSGSPGGVSAYRIDPRTGGLEFINAQPAGGADTSYISLDRTGRFVLVANYDGGSVAVFRIRADGGIGGRTAFVQFEGHGVDPKRQAHAYAHSIIVDPTNRFALACDLGLDRVYVFRFDASTGALAANDPPYAAVAPGSGARHPVFSRDGRRVYVVSEMGSEVTAFDWDGTRGELSAFQTISTLPPGFRGDSACAEIQLHPNGRFLYVSNRGHDSLACFGVDPDTGRLSALGWAPTRGRIPRNFAFDPTGRWIIVTNNDSDNAVVFSVDPSTGLLTQAGPPVSVPYPFCERFLEVQP
jgi:6-phosphogluconolactonase